MVHFGPFWPKEVYFGPFRSAYGTLATPDKSKAFSRQTLQAEPSALRRRVKQVQCGKFAF